MKNKGSSLMNLLVIADSGGTKTDWLVFNEFGECESFTSESFHPRFINENFINRNKLYWSKFLNLVDYRLQFYGSGCLKEVNAIKMKEALIAIGFNNPEVQSDMHAAALSLNKTSGWAAICGTGSVVFEIQNGDVVSIRGGLGRELGDEGSGYFFGKLLARKVLFDGFKVPFITFEECKEEKYFSTFANRLVEYKNEPEIRKIHQQNIQLFIDQHLKGINQIDFVGSYAFHHQEIFIKQLEQNGIQAIRFIERPIEILVAHLR